jgi:pimeloyl-ACP methyl ester carboxylesterase
MMPQRLPLPCPLPHLQLVVSCILAGLFLSAAAAVPEPFPGTPSDYHGFVRHEFTANGQRFLVVEPKQPTSGRPWIWRAEFFDHEPQADLALLALGWHVVHNPDAAGHFGGPLGVAAWQRCYLILTATYGLSTKPVLEGFSRGGTLALAWAVAHADETGGIYLDAPLLDIRSLASKPKTADQQALWAEILHQYDLTEQTVPAYDQGPLNHLAPLAAAKVPILLICGDADRSVPYEENGKILDERYRALGGRLQLILKPGGDHHPHSLKDPAPIVAFAVGALSSLHADPAIPPRP